MEYDEMDVDENTSPEKIVAILKNACCALNHEDEYYVPAIEWAIKFIETHK